LWCFIERIIEFIKEFWKILEFLLKKNRDTLNTNIFRIPSFTICFFNFLVFLASFFFILHLYGFQKIVKFLCCYTVWNRDFIKKLRYLKYKISTKFHRLLFLFYFFSIFGILLSISPIQTCPKIMEIFCSVLLEGLEILQTISWKF